MTGEKNGRPGLSLAEPGKIISASDFAKMASAKSRLRRAQAAQLVNVESMHQSAWQIGYRHGLQQAMNELSDFYSEASRRHVDPQSPVKRLVFAVLRKLLHECDKNGLMASVAERAVAETCEKLESITILVHPDVAESVARRFARYRAPGRRIDVHAADHLSPTGCEIRTVFGIIDAGLDVQLDALENSVSRGVPEQGSV